jgi:hypothetical protein
VRGGQEVEAHIAAMAPVFELAGDSSAADGEFAVRFLSALGAPAGEAGDPAMQDMGQRLRSTPPPWTYGGDLSVLGNVDVLVITGEWSPLYDEVARALQAAGADWNVLPGYGHRPQDHPEATPRIVEHLRKSL